MKNHVVGGRVVAAALLICVSACGAGESSSKGTVEGSFKVSDEATAADVGLPAYPGSTSYKDSGESSSAAQVGFSTPLFGLKVVAVKLQTPAGPEKVAAFYRQALSKYGVVVECGAATEGNAEPDAKDALVCEPDERDADSVVYKAGTRNNQRIVAIKSHARGTQFNLVHVATRED